MLGLVRGVRHKPGLLRDPVNKRQVPPGRNRRLRSATIARRVWSRQLGCGRALSNFVTAHDGFTLNDVVSYDEKHNGIDAQMHCLGMLARWAARRPPASNAAARTQHSFWSSMPISIWSNLSCRQWRMAGGWLREFDTNDPNDRADAKFDIGAIYGVTGRSALLFRLEPNWAREGIPRNGSNRWIERGINSKVIARLYGGLCTQVAPKIGPNHFRPAVALISEHIEVLARALEIAGGNADELKSLVRGSPLEPPLQELVRWRREEPTLWPNIAF